MTPTIAIQCDIVKKANHAKKTPPNIWQKMRLPEITIIIMSMNKMTLKRATKTPLSLCFLETVILRFCITKSMRILYTSIVLLQLLHCRLLYVLHSQAKVL